MKNINHEKLIEYLKNVKLNKKQKKYLEAIEWLFDKSDDFRGEGRSFLLKYIYIKLIYKGQDPTIIDHWGDKMSKDIMEFEINNIIN